MMPESGEYTINGLKTVKENTRTYCIDWESGSVSGFCDGAEALRQAIRKILGTERYAYPIYSFDYGFENEFGSFGGRNAYPIIKKNIEEALLQDDRINEVKDFSFIKDGTGVSVAFTVVSDKGELGFEKAVDNIV